MPSRKVKSGASAASSKPNRKRSASPPVEDAFKVSAPTKKRGRPKKKTASDKDPKDPSEASAPPKKRVGPTNTKKAAPGKDPSVETEETVMRSEQKWEHTFCQLVLYQSRNGGKIPPTGGSHPLGRWVHSQRETKRRGAMSDERIDMLNQIGFVWSATEQWERRYKELLVYKEEHGHTNVPQNHGNLGVWVRSQRARNRLSERIKAGEPTPASRGRNKDIMPQEQKAKLDAIGFVWKVRDENIRESWERRYNELKAYKEEHGHTNVPRRNGDLGTWVHRQRARNRLAERIKAGEPTPPSRGKPLDVILPEQKAKLDAIGFIWSVYSCDTWEGRVQDLIRYKERYGNCRVPQHWPENKQLGKWVAKQRFHYVLLKQGKQGPLTEERISELEDLGFDWGKERPNARKRKPATMDEPDEGGNLRDP